MKTEIIVKGISISLIKKDSKDYISLTDIAKYKNKGNPNVLILNWLRNKNTIAFLGLWEQLNNPNFKPVEFEGFKNKAGSKNFTLSPTKWIKQTDAIGIISTSGRYGGTFAHRDIALEFASWVSPEFKLYIITEFQRLKEKELPQEDLISWKTERVKGKVARRSLTDTIQSFIKYAEKQGSKNANRYYSNITVTTYKALELIEKAGDIGDNFRDTLNAIHLQFLGTAENIALEIFEDEMKKDTPYKEIFQIAKKKIIEFATVIIPVLELKPRERIEVQDGQGVFEF